MSGAKPITTEKEIARMLLQPLHDKLAALRLPGFLQGLEEQTASTHYADLTFEERLGMLVDREWHRRQNARLAKGIRSARFQQNALVEDLDLTATRGLDRRIVLEFTQCEWVRHHLNMIVLGPTGAGKTFLACALGQAACRQAITVRYLRTSRLLQDLAHAHADGSYPQLLNSLAKISLLIIDDWLRDPISPSQARDLLEIIDDRYGYGSTIVATQIPVAEWHQNIPDTTIADAILDRLLHNAHRLELKGESQRKKRSPLAQNDHSEV